MFILCALLRECALLHVHASCLERLVGSMYILLSLQQVLFSETLCCCRFVKRLLHPMHLKASLRDMQAKCVG